MNWILSKEERKSIRSGISLDQNFLPHINYIDKKVSLLSLRLIILLEILKTVYVLIMDQNIDIFPQNNDRQIKPTLVIDNCVD